MLQLYNTETKKKEKIVPIKDKEIRIYTCGPTVYHYAHIGNFRTYVFEDILRKTLKLFGYKVIQVMNITDVEDKTIKGAQEKKLSLEAFTKPYKKVFFDDLQILGIERAEYYPEATKYVEQMIEMIKYFLEKKIAYIGKDKSVYFSISSFPRYGRLSHLKLDELKKGASGRLEDEYDKDNAADFVLWKAYDAKRDGDVVWDSPFGQGRPGWHIECSAMAITLLGYTIDIHCGGIDNIFPHHENEIAQSESFTNKKFVNHWCHVKHLIVDDKKMSKSLGNYYILKDLLQKGFTGKEMRYLLMQTHYRTKLNFTVQGLQAARSSLKRISDFIDRLKQIEEEKDDASVHAIIKTCEERFFSSLADDINISACLAALFDLIRDVNTLCDKKQIGKKYVDVIFQFLKKIDQVLGVIPFHDNAEIPSNIQEAIQNRSLARQNKDWKKADDLREYIYSQGFIIEDTPEKTVVKKR